MTDTVLDKESFVPMSKQIANIIIQQVIDGTYKLGESIPSQGQLKKEYEVSLITVRLAFKELVELGIIETRKGKSTKVIKIPSQQQRNYHTIRGFTADQQRRKVSFTVDKISIINGTDHIREILELNKVEKIVEIRRAGEINNKYVTVQVAYLNATMFSQINWSKDLKDGDSLYSLLKSKAHLNIVYAEEEIDAVCCPQEHQKILSLTKKDPLLYIKRKTFSKKTYRSFEYCEYYIIPQYYGTITIFQR